MNGQEEELELVDIEELNAKQCGEVLRKAGLNEEGPPGWLYVRLLRARALGAHRACHFDIQDLTRAASIFKKKKEVINNN